MSTEVLTDLERRMLAFISAYALEHGNGPTLAEIGKGCGVQSVGTVHRYVTSIENKGFLEKVRRGWRPRKPKEVVVTGDGRTAEDWHREYSRKVYELNRARDEIARLRQALREYGDRARMSNAEPDLQIVIDAAFAETEP